MQRNYNLVVGLNLQQDIINHRKGFICKTSTMTSYLILQIIGPMTNYR